MPEPLTISVPQGTETPATGVQRSHLAYRYAYARSAESCAAGEPGQDYLTVREDGQRLAFALCDGVGQSFFGDLAARLLGDRLRDLLWASAPHLEGDDLRALLEEGLADLTGPAGAAVAAQSLPDGISPMLRAVLEQKRALGSESTLTCGLIDLAAGRIVLAWLGDTRLRLWRRDGEATGLLGDTFRTAERWSSRRGVIGTLHTFAGPIAGMRRLVAYSDGLQRLDAELAVSPDATALNTHIQASGQEPGSDDRAFIEVCLSAVSPDWLGIAPPAPVHPASAAQRDGASQVQSPDQIQRAPAPPALALEVNTGLLTAEWAGAGRLALPEPAPATQRDEAAYVQSPAQIRRAPAPAALAPSVALAPTSVPWPQAGSAMPFRLAWMPMLGFVGVVVVATLALLMATLLQIVAEGAPPSQGAGVGGTTAVEAAGESGEALVTMATPTPTASATATASATSTASATATPTATLTPGATSTVTATATAAAITTPTATTPPPLPVPPAPPAPAPPEPSATLTLVPTDLPEPSATPTETSTDVVDTPTPLSEVPTLQPSLTPVQLSAPITTATASPYPAPDAP